MCYIGIILQKTRTFIMFIIFATHPRFRYIYILKCGLGELGVLLPLAQRNGIVKTGFNQSGLLLHFYPGYRQLLPIFSSPNSPFERPDPHWMRGDSFFEGAEVLDGGCPVAGAPCGSVWCRSERALMVAGNEDAKKRCLAAAPNYRAEPVLCVSRRDGHLPGLLPPRQRLPEIPWFERGLSLIPGPFSRSSLIIWSRRRDLTIFPP